MKLAIGADHRGRDAVERVAQNLEGRGHEVTRHLPGDTGVTGDYPDFAWRVGHAVACRDADFGILICGAGVGMCIAANKITGVRAAPVHDEITAEISRAHVDANVLCLSADLMGLRLMEKIIDLWLETPFAAGRHDRRVRKIEAIQRQEDPTEIE